jgi:hypothetical protein
MLEYGLRFLAGVTAVSAFAALGDTLRLKSFAGLFGTAPSIALATLLITLSQKGAPFAVMEGRSMILEAFALAACSCLVSVLLKKFLPSSRAATMAACYLVRSRVWCIGGSFSALMIVQFKPSALRQTRWYEYLVRFALGGAMTVVAGLIAARFGPVFGGLVLDLSGDLSRKRYFDRKACPATQRESGSAGSAARQGSRGNRCRRSGTWKFWAGGFRPRDLADDRSVCRLGSPPRCASVDRCRDAGMAGAAMVVEG